MATLLGRTLGNYRVVEQLGRGGMAAVYKAYQPSLERYVAIKVIHEQLVAQDEQFFKRFHREAKVVASLHHPNIVPVFDFGVEGDIPYMVMEYLQGRSLKAELRELNARGETMPPEEVVRIVREVAGAVDYAYRQGIVHHDLKPDNVMLTTKGDTILTDFGIAKIAGGTQVTVSGMVMGTPTYMSPEQGKGERGDQRSDVYSLGVILYEMVTGRVPFEADTPLAVILKHISDPLPLPRFLNPGIPERVEQVILKALAKAPEDRFQSTGLMARALEEAISGEQAGGRWQPPADGTTSPEAVLPLVKELPETLAAPGASPIVPAPQPSRGAGRRAAVPVVARIAGGAVLLTLATVLVIQAWRELRDRAGRPPVVAGAGATSTVRPTPTTGAPPAAPAHGSKASIDLGATNMENGMAQFEFADGQTLAKTVGGREARATARNPSTGRYIYFNIDDAFLYSTETAVAVTVTYYDQGSFDFWIDYDSTDLKASGGGIWKRTRTRYLSTDSRQWMTATFVLDDAFFGGRQHNDADFRIAMGEVVLYVDSVTVSKLSLPPVAGPDPSESLAAFYYPWYRNAAMDGEWVHWQEPDFQPPSDISSDYYPTLGAYSSVDPATVAQHFAWLRESGVGLIISSWWGQGSPTDQAALLLLELGAVYDVRIAFHIEPHAERTADQLLEDVQYLYARYGEHPAFYRTTKSSPWIQDNRPKGLFFVFGPAYATEAEPEVRADYWREAMNAIHALPDGGIIIAATTDCSWVDQAHFDGLYNYITPHLGEENAFNWSRCIRRGAWYVPSVIPGNSPRRIGYPEDLYEPRRDGATYDAQWDAALATGVRPQIVTVTSFNEWHEGTQIEPAMYGMTSGRGYTYDDYGPLGERGYLTLTRQWADKFRLMEWAALPAMRVHITTTSDWTALLLLSGGTWIQPETISATEEATMASLSDNRINLNQSLDRAQAREQVELLMDLSLMDMDAGGALAFEIQRGNIGWTKVELFDLTGPEPTLVATHTWGGTTDGLNPYRIELPAASLVGEPAP